MWIAYFEPPVLTLRVSETKIAFIEIFHILGKCGLHTEPSGLTLRVGTVVTILALVNVDCIFCTLCTYIERVLTMREA